MKSRTSIEVRDFVIFVEKIPRFLYLRFPIFQTLSGKLTWSHLIEIIGIENDLEDALIKQMENFCSNWDTALLSSGDSPPIGIILGADKNEVMEQYATYGMNANLFVAKYQLYLPEIEDLKNLVRHELDRIK